MTGRAPVIEELAAWWAVHDGDINLKGRYIALFAELTDIQLGDLYKATIREVVLRSPVLRSFMPAKE